MKGCATQFNNEYSEGEDSYLDVLEYDYEVTLSALELQAKRFEHLALRLRAAIASCKDKHSTEGLNTMVALAFNSQEFTPSYGGVGQLPPSDEPYNVMISKTEGVETKDGKGQMLALTLTVLDGPEKGNSQIDRLNLFNLNSDTVRIAQGQLSAYCHVTGMFALQDTDQLRNIPFKARIRKQKNDERYTEVAEIYYANGNPVGKGGGGGQQQQQQQGNFGQGGGGGPAGGVTAQGPVNGGFGQAQGGQPQGGGGGFGQGGQGQGNNGVSGPENGPTPPNGGGGFGQPQGGNNGGFGQPNSNQGGFGNPQGGGNNGWPQQGNNNGGAPGWGKPNG